MVSKFLGRCVVSAGRGMRGRSSVENVQDIYFLIESSNLPTHQKLPLQHFKTSRRLFF
jgi:hypothetical protein